MDTRVAAWALLLLLSALVMEVRDVRASDPPRKLCGDPFRRAVLEVCWSLRAQAEQERPTEDNNGPQFQRQEPPLPFAEQSAELRTPEDTRGTLFSAEQLTQALARPGRALGHKRVLGACSCCHHGCTVRDLHFFCF